MSSNPTIPSNKLCPGTLDPSYPYVFIGNETFGMGNSLMRPYSQRLLSHVKCVFNYRLSCAPRMVECTFGILANKWCVLHTPIPMFLDKVFNVVKATFVLQLCKRKGRLQFGRLHATQPTSD